MKKFRKDIKRIYHPFHLWEEVEAGMWKDTPKEQEQEKIKECTEFMSDHKLFGHNMQRVIKEWKYSCENWLSFKGMNRIAWIGQAACCIALNCPEYIVRQSWGYLTEEQRQLANEQAEIAITIWEDDYYDKTIVGN